MSEIIICPVCGFSFKYSDAKTIGGKIVCPMCRHKFMGSKFIPFTSEKYDNKYQ